MQTARLLEPRPRTLGTKLMEMARALQLEARYSKDQVLSMYLTLAPFGGNLEGVRAASLSYFDKEPDRLTLAEAALLVALPQSPERLRPDRHADAARQARQKILTRLRERGVLSEHEVTEASMAPVPQRRLAFAFHAPRLSRRLAHDRQREIHPTSIDRTIQIGIEHLVASEVRWTDDNPAIAVIVVENATRQVKAYLGGADFWAPGGQVDMARAARSPGSALKPFIYGLGFDDLLIHPETLIRDHAAVFGTYAPENFAGTFQGSVSIRQALRQSLNVPAVSLLNEVGPIRFAAVLGQHGADLQYARKGIIPSLPLALGGVGITLEDLTALYVALANGGQYAPLRYDGSTGPDRRKTMLGETAAWYVTDILRGTPMPEGWAHRFGIDRDRNVAFKTGTSYGFRDAWAVGYTGTYTVGVFVGRPDGTPRPGHFGLNSAAPILLKVFALLPAETADFRAKPENVISVRHRNELPAGLQTFAPAVGRTAAIVPSRPAASAPRIKFPADGVAVALPDARGLELRAYGGAAPLRWMVNDVVLPATEFLEPTVWHPSGPGFADITVIDAAGRSDHAHVRLIEGKTAFPPRY